MFRRRYINSNQILLYLLSTKKNPICTNTRSGPVDIHLDIREIPKA